MSENYLGIISKNYGTENYQQKNGTENYQQKMAQKIITQYIITPKSDDLQKYFVFKNYHLVYYQENLSGKK